MSSAFASSSTSTPSGNPPSVSVEQSPASINPEGPAAFAGSSRSTTPDEQNDLRSRPASEANPTAGPGSSSGHRSTSNVLPPIPLDPTLPSTVSLRPGTTFSSRLDLQTQLSKRCYEHGFSLVVYRSPNQYDNGLAKDPAWKGRLVLACSLTQIVPSGKTACPFRIEVYFRDVGTAAEVWKIAEVEPTHNHPPEDLGEWRKPEIRQDGPRKCTRRDKEHSEPETEESSSRPSQRPRYSVSFPFPTNLRLFRTLSAFYITKEQIATEMGVTLWSGGGTEPTRFICSVGQSKKAGTSGEGCPWKVKVRQASDGYWRVDETSSVWEHSHALAPSMEEHSQQNGFLGGSSDSRPSPAPAPRLQAASTSSRLSPSSTGASPFSTMDTPKISISSLDRFRQQLRAQMSSQGGQPTSAPVFLPAHPARQHAGQAQKAYNATSVPLTALTSGNEAGSTVGTVTSEAQKGDLTTAKPHIDLTLDSDEDDLKPVKLEPGLSASQRDPRPSSTPFIVTAFSHSTTPARSASAPITSLSTFLDALDPSLSLSRFEALFDNLGITLARLRVMKRRDVGKLVELLMEEAKASSWFGGVVRLDLGVLGDRLRETLQE
ncbi:hypothetical protein JCM8097_003782 [Rhodosporidiobolus ruineniae]